MRQISERVAIHTLGCKVNQNESEALAAEFIQKGYEIVDFAEEADIYIINTCTVTHLSDRKSRQMLRRAVRKNPEATVVATGCYSQVNSEEIEKISGVDLILGNQEKYELVHLVESYRYKGEKKVGIEDISQIHSFGEFSAERLIGRTRAYLKIQDGCEQFCSYCIIPYARGPLRSRKAEMVIAEAKSLCERGFREIILTGIHVGMYGRENGEINLVQIIQRIMEETNIARLRLSSIEPVEVTSELIELAAKEERFCPHFHIPLQNGSDEILTRMNRPYDTTYYAELVEFIRAKIKEVAITSDLMVGFPGETEDNFRQSYDFIKRMGFSSLHVFKYSPRKGTPAADFADQIPESVKDRRSALMLDLAQELTESFAKEYLGKTVEVLLEEEISSQKWRGHTGNYLQIIATGEASSGIFARVRIEKSEKGVLFGRIIEDI